VIRHYEAIGLLPKVARTLPAQIDELRAKMVKTLEHLVHQLPRG
jgi:DNA-binding transcriptional MerR regulator